MPRGGARVGAGRPKKGEKAPHLRSSASDEAPVAFEFLTSAVRDPDLPFADRLRAASVLLPYEKRRIQPLQPLGRKERAAEAGLDAAVGPFAPPPVPPALLRAVNQAGEIARTALEPGAAPKARSL